uniref:Uncharacterized protein n=1 Tax=Stegastes partitus TaxID=144197 RepID=A0A3B5ACP6_9TELE
MESSFLLTQSVMKLTHHWSGTALCLLGTGGCRCWGPGAPCSALHIHKAFSKDHPESLLHVFLPLHLHYLLSIKQ